MTRPPTTSRAYVTLAGGQVHCRIATPERATRPPLLCLHMSPKSGWVFEPLLGLLGADRLVIAPDTPGFGMSDRPAAPPEISDYADALIACADTFSPGAAFDILGYHTGSLIAVDIALRHPRSVNRLALISAPVMTAEETAAFRDLGLGKPPEFDAAGDKLLALWRLVLRWRSPGSDLALAARSLADTLIAGDTGWWGHRAAFAHDFASGLGRVRHPLGILNPGDDLVEPTRRARAMRPDALYLERPDWAHGFIHQWPAEAASAIRVLLGEGA